MSPFLLVTDLDNTLVYDDEKALKDLKELNDKLDKHRQEYGTKIVYTTGRSLPLYQQLKKQKSLLEPDALISSAGTEIHIGSNYQTADKVWSEKLSIGWNRDLIAKIAAKFNHLVPQQKSEQRPLKISYKLAKKAAEEVIPQLKSELKSYNLDCHLIYSGGKNLDVLPYYADLGLAVKFLQYRWKMQSNATVVCGDGGNDIPLFKLGEVRGIIVGNALPALRQWYKFNSKDFRYLAKNFYAAGILEGLQHFKFI